jgi:hypothetical protein
MADADLARAAQALIEGDATLAMQHYSLGALSLEDQLAMATDPRVLGAQQEAGDFPYVLSNALQFPYLDGMTFACALYENGGWEAIDAAYDQPPVSTVEIIFPEKYAAGFTPSIPDPVGGPGEGWELLRQTSFGALDLLTLFSAPGDDQAAALSDPRERVAAWAGGTVSVWTQGEATAVGIALVGTGEGTALCDSMNEWSKAAYEDPTNVVIVCDGDQVRVGIAPTPETSTAIATGQS